MIAVNRARRWLAGLALVTLVAGGTALVAMQRPAKAAGQVYNIVFKGLTRTLDGTKVPFIATGTGTVDFMTGSFSYDVTAPAIMAAIGGEGTLANGPKISYGLSSFDSGTWQGTAIINGKFSKEASKFRGKITVAIPNHIGPAPNGFTYTTGTISMDIATE